MDGADYYSLMLELKKVRQKARKEEKQLFITPLSYTGPSKLLAMFIHLVVSYDRSKASSKSSSPHSAI